MVITVGRQVGSLGHHVAKKLAQELGFKFYDKEIIALAAEESGFDPQFFEKSDEKHGFFRSFFGASVPTGALVNYEGSYTNRFSQEGLFRFQSQAILKAASEGDCVIVGRCADYILREQKDVLNIFITTDYEERVQSVMNWKDYTRHQAEKYIREGQDSRTSYYNFYTGKKWGDAATYDLTINSSKLGVDGTVEYIKQFVENLQK